MFDLTKFTSTRKSEFQQLALDRKDDFEALRKQERWTASVYLGPYIVEARLKFKVCEVLKYDSQQKTSRSTSRCVQALWQ